MVDRRRYIVSGLYRVLTALDAVIEDCRNYGEDVLPPAIETLIDQVRRVLDWYVQSLARDERDRPALHAAERDALMRAFRAESEVKR